METLDIPLLRKIYELYKEFHALRSVIPKADRYTLWQRAENVILDILEEVLLTSQLSKQEKLSHLERVSAKLNVLRILLRLTKDTKILDLKKCLILQTIVDEIGRMIGGWIKSTKENAIAKPPPHFVKRRRIARRKFRADARAIFGFALSFQLLLTFTPSASNLTMSRLPLAS